MIVYVDIEHDRVRGFPEIWQDHCAKTLDIKYKLEQISGEPCLVMRYTDVSLAALDAVAAKAVLISGNRTEFQHYTEEDLAGLREIIRQSVKPTLGICGGAMMIAESYGSTAAPIDPAGEGDMFDDAWRERKHESGFMQVKRTQPHPLFEGIDDTAEFMELHYWEIKSVPDGFERFAETETTPVQFIAHRDKPLFATQFHPERFDAEHQAGARFLENFFKLMDG